MLKSSERVLDARLLFSIIAAGIMSASGIVVETAMNVTFPTLMHEFNIGTSLVQWITTGYLLVLALFKTPLLYTQPVYYCNYKFSHRHTASSLVTKFQLTACRQAFSRYWHRYRSTNDVQYYSRTSSR